MVVVHTMYLIVVVCTIIYWHRPKTTISIECLYIIVWICLAHKPHVAIIDCKFNENITHMLRLLFLYWTFMTNKINAVTFWGQRNQKKFTYSYSAFENVFFDANNNCASKSDQLNRVRQYLMLSHRVTLNGTDFWRFHRFCAIERRKSF